MRILFVVDGLKKGGAGRVVAQLSNVLQEKGNDVCIEVLSSKECAYPINDAVCVFDGVRRKKKGIPTVVKFVKSVKNGIKSFNPDVIISFLTTNNIASIIASAISKKKKVIISERIDPASVHSKRYIDILRDLSYKRADGYVFQTEQIRNFFDSDIQNKSRIIANPVNPLIPHPYDGERDKKIVMAGRLTEQKNYPMAIRAFKKICEKYPDFKLEIFGDGALKKELIEYTKSCNLSDKVIFRGQVDNIFEEMKKASLFLMTSDYEGMSNSLMEAMALGLPVISTDHGGGGASALIENGTNGILIPVGDSDELAMQIDKVLSDKEYAEKIGKQAAKTREKYSVDAILEQWSTYIKEIVG